MQTTSSETSSERSSTPRLTGGLAAWALIALIQIAVAFSAQQSGELEGEPLYEYDLALGSIVIYSILIGLTILIAHFGYDNTKEALGLTSFSSRWIWITFGLVVLSLIVSAALEPLLHAGEEQGLVPTDWEPERAEAYFANAFVIVTVVPLAEELFFRGLGVRALGSLGAAAAVIGTSLVFGLAHGILVALPPLVFFGLALAWVRLRSNSVWPGVLAHAVYNGIGVSVPFLVS
jgi:membrane protease YdiL (CAAX protease family)